MNCKTKKESVKPSKNDPLRVIKEHFPGEKSSLRDIIHQLIPGAVDSIEIKVYEPCLNSPRHQYDQPGYTTIRFQLFKGQINVAEQTGVVENKSALKQLVEEFVYIYGCGRKAANITIDCEAAEYPAYSILHLNKN